MNQEQLPYPVQMGSIAQDRWRMQSFIDKGLSLEALEKEENKLWNTIERIARGALPPPQTCDIFPGSDLIRYSWEWAAYVLPNSNEVVKVPAGTFPEVNDPEYLENTRYAYEVLKKFVEPFLVETFFERIQNVNVLRQRRIVGEEPEYIDPSQISVKSKKSLQGFVQSLIELLEQHQWLPDIHLWRRKVNSKRVWNIWNLIFEGEQPWLFDFTSYHDPFRLYPERTKSEVKKNRKLLQSFLKEIRYSNY